eukprot:TRINITY_DN1049_c0_g1_i5.p1 TRINITY_DN1049_c0_g1~~TRINITY_DN1049_c0_g1_i5.p1  ORF type:complete len:322 (-),score=49.90 TRINITY_DN1049_c0_g1_i5:820-1785(-)
MLISGKIFSWAFVFVLGLVHCNDYEDSAADKILEAPNKAVKQFPSSNGTETKLLRTQKVLGTLSDQQHTGVTDKTYPVKKQKKIKKSRGVFRSNKRPRGSRVSPQSRVKPLPHQPHGDDPQGCGNPICVVIDRKSVRFASICKYTQFCIEQSRANQMNFIQKGDCYDIIDNDGGALTKPWTPPDLDLGDCSACKKDEFCGKTLTVNIDLKNLLLGESSAFGGKSFNEQNAQYGRMVGVPIEFDSVCSLMKFLKSKQNLNILTQVMGVAIGVKKDIFPLDPLSTKCLWTEWFDHDTPCNSDGGQGATHRASAEVGGVLYRTT